MYVIRLWETLNTNHIILNLWILILLNYFVLKNIQSDSKPKNFNIHRKKKVVMANDFNLTPNRICIRIVPNSSCYLLRLQKCSNPKYNSAYAKIVLPNAIVFVPNTVLQIQVMGNSIQYNDKNIATIPIENTAENCRCSAIHNQ